MPLILTLHQCIHKVRGRSPKQDAKLTEGQSQSSQQSAKPKRRCSSTFGGVLIRSAFKAKLSWSGDRVRNARPITMHVERRLGDRNFLAEGRGHRFIGW